MDMQDPQYKTEDGSALRIWRDAAQNNFLTEREGRPIFDDVIYVEVISPGSGNSTPIFEVVRKLAKEAKHPDPKYGIKYNDFKKYIEDFIKDEKSDASLAGTPLSQWSELSRTLVASMKAQKIYTVEALAELPDGKLTVVGPDGRTWREKARAYLELAKGNAHATALAADLERSNQTIADQQGQISALAEQIRVLTEKQDGGTAPAAEVLTPVTEPEVRTPAAPAATIPQPLDQATLDQASLAAAPII